MAINTVTIQMRMGLEADFDPSKMLPGEWAVSTDTRYVRMCFSPGIVLRMATYESFEADMAQIQAILAECKDIKSAIQRIQSEVNAKASLTIEYANAAEKSAKNAKQSEEKAKMYAENAEAVTGVEIATKDRAGVMKGGDNHIAEDGTLELTRRTTDRTLTDSYAGGLKIIEVDGASEQAQYAGKNLLKCTLGNMTYVGVTITNNGDGTYTLNGTATATVSDIYLATGVTIKAGTYKVTGYPAGATGWIQLNHSGGAITSTTFTLSADTVCDVRLELSNGVRYNNVILKPMIASDTTATYDDFEPYVGGKPSPSPEYPQPIKSVGDSGSLEIKAHTKNLFNPETVVKGRLDNGVLGYESDVSDLTVIGDTITCTTVNSTYRGFVSDYMTVNDSVAVSFISTGGYSAIDIFDKNKKYLRRVYFDVEMVLSLSDNEAYIRLNFQNTAIGTFTVSNIQVELGEKVTDFVPYQSNSITISLSEPLRAYDRIVKQDGVWGVLRGTRSVVFDGSADEGWKSNNYGFYIILSNMKIPSTTETNYICTHYTPIRNGESWNGYENWISNNNNALYFYKGELTTVEEWKAKLQANPIKVTYELATPTFEPLPTADQIALNSLLSFDGVTHIYFDSEIEPVIEVEYGTSRVGGYTLDALNTAKRNEAQIASLVALTNDLATTMVEREE